jgi:hypothetical protein
MSLIRVRRSRKKDWIDVKKGTSAARLTVFLAVVVAVIWYLSVRF